MFNNKLYVYGDQEIKVPAHLNFGKFILNRIRRKGDEVALENAETEEKITYKELTEYAVKLCVALTELGVNKGDVVALGSENRLMFMPTALAIILSGATYTSYDFNCGHAHLHHKLSIAQPKHLICTELFWTTNQEVLERFTSITTFITLDKALQKMVPLESLISKNISEELFEPIPVQRQIDTMCIFYSSGTTGMPKGVALTHMNCILQVLVEGHEEESSKVVYVTGDWFHTYDFFVFFKMLTYGKKIVYSSNLNTAIILKAFETQLVNLAFLVPSIVSQLAKTDEKENYALESLNVVYSTSSPLHVKTMAKLKERFPSIKHVLQGYGTTEVGTLTSEIWGANGPRPGSVGGASPGNTLKVVHPETRKVLGPNEHGEICMRGPGLMKGYINVDSSTYLDEDGFFGTGDLGYYDEDRNFYIIDRLKEIIDYDGYQVAPLELETILLLHPGVRDAGVVGKPVQEYGEEPTAFVVRQPDSDVTGQELVDFVAKEVAPYMQLKGGVKFISELPRNPRGKILRRRLREML